MASVRRLTGDHTPANPHSAGNRCIWNDAGDLTWLLNAAITLNLRQLLLQAYCTFSVYHQHEVFIMLISGSYFSMLKFTHPNDFKPLLPGSNILYKKRKLGGAKEPATGEPECQEADKILNPQLITLIPLECVEVIYHYVPVFDDIQARELHLSNAFRQALRERLDDVDFQPCSLFDLRHARYVPRDKDLVRPIELRALRNSQVISASSQGFYF